MSRPSTTVAAPAPSALTALISQTRGNADPVSALTTQVFHNLQHQHLWTSLITHYPHEHDTDARQLSEDAAASLSLGISLPVPLVSGIPPHRVYTHPDEQLYLLKIGLREEDLPSERIWVLPSTQTQSWTLEKLGTVFDALPSPSSSTREYRNNNLEQDTNGQEKERKLAQYFEQRQKADEQREWGGKRLLLAMVDRLVGGDGTIVYYVVQDGHVKPRQN